MGMGTTIATILMVYMLILVVIAVCGLVELVLKGFALSAIGKRKGLTNTWLAFIPYARLYFQGLIAGEVPVFGKKIKNTGLFILIYQIITGTIVGGITTAIIYTTMFNVWSARGEAPFGIAAQQNFTIMLYMGSMLLGFLTNIIAGIRAIMNYQIYKSVVRTNTAIFHTVLSVLIPLYETICLFALRNKPFLEENEEEPQESVTYQNTTWT